MAQSDKPKTPHSGRFQRVYLVCLNPKCPRSGERCLTMSNMHEHPHGCSAFYYPVEAITTRHWTKLEKYPADNLGVAAKKKLHEAGEKGYFAAAIKNVRDKFEDSLKQLQQSILALYPEKEFSRSYANVYNLERIAEELKIHKNPAYISSLISDNFSAQNYHVLLRLNENYDQIRNTLDGLGSKVLAHFDVVLNRHRQFQRVSKDKNQHPHKINFGVYKSKFIASSKIEFQGPEVRFPKISNISSFLPWIYTDCYFTEGTHEFKFTSLKYPIVQNAGFTVLQEQDIDTYPYTYFKSLFSREGKGFRLTQGEDIDQFMAQTTVVVLRLELSSSPRALIFDSEMRGVYECQLQEKSVYRMGVYGCGWAMEVIELN